MNGGELRLRQEKRSEVAEFGVEAPAESGDGGIGRCGGSAMLEHVQCREEG